MDKEQLKKAALKYHTEGKPGKIEINTTKSCTTQEELSLAYTPGVAYPSLEIAENKKNVFRYTNRKNLVGVISNGTAVLGLGDIGALASKPVMEGKAVLFKRFANIDVFDIEIDEKDPQLFVDTVRRLEPTFGGINLEDIKAPECFFIEKQLKKTMNIPVFHDDQHGTAIIVGAGLINAIEVAKKDMEEVKIVFSGAGAAGISCANFIVSLGVKKEHIFMFDKNGPLTSSRDDLSEEQFVFAHNHYKNLDDAISGADVFIGVSAGGILKKEMVAKMADSPIIFALANPFPEITYEDAKSVRDDVIMATGRSDYPNQVNNVLGFPFIFRGALDVAATKITENMKIAAAKALSELAKEDVPDYLNKLYKTELKFGKDYIIPKAFDHRVIIYESSNVALSAINDGVAKERIDIELYKKELEKLSVLLMNKK